MAPRCALPAEAVCPPPPSFPPKTRVEWSQAIRLTPRAQLRACSLTQLDSPEQASGSIVLDTCCSAF